MQESHLSFRMRENLSFISTRQLFLQIFMDHRLDPNSIISEDSCRWFIDSQSGFQNFYGNAMEASEYAEKDSLLRSIFSRNIGKEVDIFISDLLETIFEIHAQIKDRDILLEKNSKIVEEARESIKIIEEIIKKKTRESQKEDLNNSICLHYVKDKSYCFELFKRYKLKYKASSDSSNFSSIFSEKDPQKNCILSLLDSQTLIQIKVMGKNVAAKDHEFKVIAEIKLPLIEIYSSVEPGDFLKEKIPPVYLLLEFKDQIMREFEEEINKFELRFDLNLSMKKRLDVLLMIKENFMVQKTYYNESVKRRISLIDTITFPFSQQIYYDLDAGLISKRSPKKKSICNINCLIY